jgi:hypothetical protein
MAQIGFRNCGMARRLWSSALKNHLDALADNMQ